MKKTFLIILFFINLYALPSWYYNLKSKNQNIYIGYGSGISEKEAKTEALSDIASAIKTKIESKFEKDASLDTTYHKNIKLKQKQITSAILSDYKIIKLEFIDGKYYVAIEYENIPAIDKFIKKAKFNKSIKNPKGYIYQTPLSKEIFAKLKKKIKLEIFYKDNNWHLKSEDAVVALDEKNFLKLFKTVQNSNLILTISKSPLFENDLFYFKVKSTQDGFITLFDVYENGESVILFKNIKVNKNKTIIIPSKNAKFDLIAGVLEGNKSYDLFVVVFSKTKKVYDEFSLADEEFSKDNKNFAELLMVMDKNVFSSIKVLTKKR